MSEHHDRDDAEHDHDHSGHDHESPGQGPGHSHGHGHSHAPASCGTAFAVGVTLNGAFVVVEVVYGLFAHSLALIADAGHNLSDVFGLLLAWGATAWARRAPTSRHTYGWRRSSILAALGNAVLLLVSVGIIGWEAARRLQEPAAVNAGTMIWVSALGIAINTGTALMFMRGRHGDLNVRGAFLHMAADALISAGVVVAGVVIAYTGWRWLDPVVSLVLVAVVIVGTWGLLRDSVNLALDAVPPGVDMAGIRTYLAGLPSVVEVHHLHVWGLSTSEVALTVHVVLASNPADNLLLSSINHDLHERFGIGHATIQFEASGPECPSRECSSAVEETSSHPKS